MPVLKNNRHEVFAQAIAKGTEQHAAYAAAGYKPSTAHAARLAARDDVRGRINELFGAGAEVAKIDIARTLQELVRIGMSDLRNAFNADGELLRPPSWTDEFAASVAAIEVVKRSLGEGEFEYVHKIKLWDKNSALEKIARHLGMFVEKVELSGKGGAPLAAVVNVTIGRAQP